MANRIALLLLVVPLGLAVTTGIVPQSDLKKRVPMTTVLPNVPVLQSFQTAHFHASFREDRWRVTGEFGAHNQWQLSLPPALRGVWKTGPSNEPTYFFAGYTGGAGIAPPTWIFTLTFHASEAPRPFYIAGYSEYDSKGIKDVVTLDGGLPQLIQQDWYGANWDRSEIASQSGYWITTLYELKEGYWRRIAGRHGSCTFPLFEKWSRWAGQPPLAVSTNPVPEQDIPDHGNSPSMGFQTTIHLVGSDIVRPDPELGCGTISPAVVVHDSPNSRCIEVQELGQHRLITAIARSRPSVILSGITRWGTPPKTCEVAVLWAKRP